MYPTRRMIFVALAGVALSLAAAMMAPSAWLIGVAWILFCVSLFLLDALLSAGPTGMSFTAQFPAALGVARAENGSVALSFGRGAPSIVELAIDSGKRMRVVPERQTCT